jgi:uncharacterized protein YjbI with pentapeptide repeats
MKLRGVKLREVKLREVTLREVTLREVTLRGARSVLFKRGETMVSSIQETKSSTGLY